MVVRTSRSPNPLFFFVGVTISGPPRSVHVTERVSPRIAHWIWIRPVVVESAPYFVAFVVNSFSSNAKLEITDVSIFTSHPVTENLEACESPGTSWGAVMACMREWSVAGFAACDRSPESMYALWRERRGDHSWTR
jgi:hypothetical protein